MYAHKTKANQVPQLCVLKTHTFYHNLSISNSSTIEILAMGTSRVSSGAFPVFPLPLIGARPASSPKLDAAGNLVSEPFEDNAFQVCVARNPKPYALSPKH